MQIVKLVLAFWLRERDDHTRQIARDRARYDETTNAKYDQCDNEKSKCKIRRATKQ
jgi:hypothetical protein